MKKNFIYAILWKDAAYTFKKNLPRVFPYPNLTTGLIVETNDKFTFVATNVHYNQKTRDFSVVDGMVIPNKAIIKIKEIGKYDEK